MIIFIHKIVYVGHIILIRSERERIDMGELFCDVCDDFVNYNIITKEETFNILGKEEITIKSRIAVCEKCETELFHEELEEENQRKAFDIYRENNNLLYPEEIIEIRKKYQLTQKEMSKLLGWGEITYHRYENGSLPNLSHNNQLALMKNPNNVRMILDNGNHKLNEEKVKELEETIDQLIKEETSFNKEISCMLPSEFYEELQIRAKKLNMGIEEYTRYLIMRRHYKDVIQDTKNRVKAKTIMQLLKGNHVLVEKEDWNEMRIRKGRNSIELESKIVPNHFFNNRMN